MPIYQVKYIQRNRLTIEVEAYSEDDAVNQADLMLADPNRFDADELEIYVDDVERVVADWEADADAETEQLSYAEYGDGGVR